MEQVWESNRIVPTWTQMFMLCNPVPSNKLLVIWSADTELKND